MEIDIANVVFQSEFDINNIEFQNNNILLHSLKMRLFGYIVQKLRLNSHFPQNKNKVFCLVEDDFCLIYIKGEGFVTTRFMNNNMKRGHKH